MSPGLIPLPRSPRRPARPSWLLFALIGVLLSSCHPVPRTAELDSLAQAAFHEVRQHQNEALEQRFGPEWRGPDFKAQLAVAERVIPQGDPRRHRALGTALFTSTAGTTAVMTDEYDYSNRAVLVQIQAHRAAATQGWEIQRLHVQVATFEQLAANDFTLTGRTVGEYAFLALILASPLVCAAAVVKVLMTSGLRRKWLWCIVAAFGICAFRMNWANGVVSVSPLYFLFLGAGAMRSPSPFSPWILSVALPIGAVLILAGVWANPKRRGMKRAGLQEP